jgi:hypothetical protein
MIESCGESVLNSVLNVVECSITAPKRRVRVGTRKAICSRRDPDAKPAANIHVNFDRQESGRAHNASVCGRRSATPVHALTFRRSREAGAVASARSSAADSPRTRCPPPLTDRRHRAVDHRLSVADRPLHVSWYGRLNSGPGGRGTARRVVRPALASAETLLAIGIDQDRDGGLGVRLISDSRRPESLFAGRVSRRRTRAQVDFGVPGHVPTRWDNQTDGPTGRPAASRGAAGADRRTHDLFVGFPDSAPGSSAAGTEQPDERFVKGCSDDLRAKPDSRPASRPPAGCWRQSTEPGDGPARRSP